MESCNICTEKYTEKERLKIKCQYCEFVSCRKCCKKYLLNETKAKCMNNDCDREWTRQFLRDNFTQTFINKDYKTHRENVLFNNERALMPMTQPLVENVIRREKITVEKEVLLKEIRAIQHSIFILDNEYNLLGRRNTGNRERALFIKACPDPECRGFLSSQWKCGICEKWTCPHCNVVKGIDREIEHECNPDDVSTALLLHNDTKSCPSCGTGIFKIEGCDQMWCTQCNTGFSWRTGRIEENNRIHNPHYFEWLRRNGGAVANTNINNEAGCRRVLDNYFLRSINNSLDSDRLIFLLTRDELRELKIRIFNYCENINHLHRVQFPYYTNNNIQHINEDLRIQYMRNQITEEKFKMSIQKQDKRFQKNREISNILNMVIETITDIIYRFHDEIKREEWVYNKETLNEIDRILIYANECLVDISKTYNSKQLSFNNVARLNFG